MWFFFENGKIAITLLLGIVSCMYMLNHPSTLIFFLQVEERNLGVHFLPKKTVHAPTKTINDYAFFFPFLQSSP